VTAENTGPAFSTLGDIADYIDQPNRRARRGTPDRAAAPAARTKSRQAPSATGAAKAKIATRDRCGETREDPEAPPVRQRAEPRASAVKRVAVTGLGVVAPGGNDAETFFASLIAGRSAVRVLDEDWCERLTTRIAAPVTVDVRAHFDAARLRMLDRVSQLALLAATQAVSSAALEWSDELRATTGVFFGTGWAARRPPMTATQRCTRARAASSRSPC
jgi:hypothetical protein